MDRSLLVFLVVGVPLILVALGFLALCLRWIWARGQRADHGKLLEAALQLDGRLAKLEVRITALEDILMGAAPGGGGQPPDPKVRSFDAELNRP
jgi:hypothetical protein